MSGYLKCMSVGWEQIFREKTRDLCLCVGVGQIWPTLWSKRPHKHQHHFWGSTGSLCALGWIWHDWRGKNTFLTCFVVLCVTTWVQWYSFYVEWKGTLLLFFNILRNISTDLDSQWSSCIFVWKEKNSFDTLFYREKVMHVWSNMCVTQFFILIVLAKFKQNTIFFFFLND